jgi:thioredoxin reductase (NADPH)
VAQLEVLRKYGTEHEMAAGDVLFAAGDATYDLIVVLAGEVRIIERRGQGGETGIAAYGPSQFVGEIGLLTGQRAYLSAVASTAGRVLRVPVEQVRVVMAQEPGLSELEGVGVYYAATQMEAQACRADPVAIVGGGNSAGQAALFLSRSSTDVHVIIRGETLATSMSRYLIDQIERNPRITVAPWTHVTALLGKDQLEGVELLDTGRGQRSALAVRGLFVFIGAQPSTQWLAGQLAEDGRGFLLTGSSIPEAQLDPGRMPLFLKTSRPGVFAVGDVRSGSVKRTATAIGKGSMAVRLVFERLEATGSAVADPPRADTETAGLE